LNNPAVIDHLKDLVEFAAGLSAICERERMEEYAPFWRSVAASAGSLQAAPTRDDVLALVRDVLGVLRYVPGGFMDMYVIRQDARELARANDAFDDFRTRVRKTAQLLDDAANQGEINPLAIRRALVDLEGWFLEERNPDEATRARNLLDDPELKLESIAAFCADLEAMRFAALEHSPGPLIKALRDALAPMPSD
jgi:hypothetical protein